MFGLNVSEKFEWMLAPWVFLSLELKIKNKEEEHYSL